MGLRRLFPAEQTRNVLSVSELTAQVKRCWKNQSARSGDGRGYQLARPIFRHIYFTLKDAAAQ